MADKLIPTLIGLYEKERKMANAIKKEYGFSSVAAAIRIAIRNEYAEVRASQKQL